jgi:hypothetical protein
VKSMEPSGLPASWKGSPRVFDRAAPGCSYSWSSLAVIHRRELRRVGIAQTANELVCVVRGYLRSPAMMSLNALPHSAQPRHYAFETAPEVGRYARKLAMARPAVVSYELHLARAFVAAVVRRLWTLQRGPRIVR